MTGVGDLQKMNELLTKNNNNRKNMKKDHINHKNTKQQNKNWKRNDTLGFDYLFPLSDHTSTSPSTSTSTLFDRVVPRVSDWGWLGGVSDVVVARPEVIIEGFYAKDVNMMLEEEKDKSKTVLEEDGEWKEIHFNFKPGDMAVSPRWVAPHQPRLDWQMWFAALGTYSHNPWFVHLLAKLLHNTPSSPSTGCPVIFGLLDETKEPLKLQQNRSVDSSILIPPPPPQFVRAKLYYYTFTRKNFNDNLKNNNDDDDEDVEDYW
eukprot:CAMPEP_0114364578 /NCGR_PEP_ID=MMETSP0101-20121206/27622_1 /TAXON_ID=38822 ORGANISM="Pteridomonas danica, Strain PT" /NCGR_SAMPLE_ID=MMETSP0101 /ASSEMBLY_ACC=CAM_ASM_000211 /LENGTH=260 /DNA_ID=CAMNT_0001512191 /DNA_START=334 /DNA_END=1113 /DNA_ORIENTATION=+